MPELPEVETIRRYLKNGIKDHPSILGKRVYRAHILWDGVLEAPGKEEFLSRIKGQTVQEVGRRGKHLLIQLTSHTLILHLRMSGDVIAETKHRPLRKHDRLVLNFEDDTRLAFNNVRKFGRAWLTANPEQLLDDLGPEPLAADFTPGDLYRILQAHSRQMKYFLLDQRMIAGLGNIYSDESLHQAGIHPRMKSDALSFQQANVLWQAIRRVLQAGIDQQGTTIDWMYRGGDYQRYLQVYGQEDQPCEQCGTIIKRTRIAQRSTYFCPTCQPPPSP